MRETGCLCCSARVCLIVWSSLSLALAILSFVAQITGAHGHLNTGNTLGMLRLAGTFLNILINLFVLVSAITRRRSMLKISYWFIIATIIWLLFWCILSVLFILGVFGERDMGDKGAAAIGVIIFYLAFVCIQALLAWVIKKTINEVDLQQTVVVQRTYVENYRY